MSDYIVGYCPECGSPIRKSDEFVGTAEDNIQCVCYQCFDCDLKFKKNYLFETMIDFLKYTASATINVPHVTRVQEAQ